MPKITNIESKQDKNGNLMNIATFDNGDKVFVNSKYDAGVFEKAIVGAEFELVEVNGFKKIKIENKGVFAPNRGGSGANIAKAQERKAEFIEKAQDRKNEAIAFFNATNNAIALIAQLSGFPLKNDSELQADIRSWRTFFLNEWIKYESGDYTDKHQAF